MYNLKKLIIKPNSILEQIKIGKSIKFNLFDKLEILEEQKID